MTRCARLAAYDPLSPQELRDPYPTWAQARTDAPVFYSEPFGVWFISRYDDVLAALRDTETFSSRFGGRTRSDLIPSARAEDLRRASAQGTPDATRFLVTSDGPEHHIRRKLAQQAFTPRRVAMLEPTIAARATTLCRQMAPTNTVELMGSFSYPLTTAVIAGILGVAEGLAAQMRQFAEDLLVLAVPVEQELSVDEVDDVIARVHRVGTLIAALTEELRARRESPRDDVLSGLVQARLADNTNRALGNDDILALAAELILAGTDTTANLIAHAVIFTSPQRTLWQQLSADDTAAAAVVEETLRLRGSSKGMFRVTTREVDVGGVTIPAGATVQLLYGSANHDESRFPDPTGFVVDRPDVDQHVGFGKGTHFCLGAPLARLEARIALRSLSRHFPELRVPDAPINYAPTLTTHTIGALDVSLT